MNEQFIQQNSHMVIVRIGICLYLIHYISIGAFYQLKVRFTIYTRILHFFNKKFLYADNIFHSGKKKRMVQWFHRKVRCHMKKKRGKKFKAAVGGIVKAGRNGRTDAA